MVKNKRLKVLLNKEKYPISMLIKKNFMNFRIQTTDTYNIKSAQERIFNSNF